MNNELCDYISACEGSEYAVREISELIMGLQGNYNDALEKRVAYGDAYQMYLAERQQVVSSYFTLNEEREIVEQAVI